MALDFSAQDPVCGMKLEPLQARGKAQYRGETYFFCSPACMHKFTASPAQYVTSLVDGENALASSTPPTLSAKKLAKDPVCGMAVDPAHAASTVEYDRKLYHFCSRQCGEKFRKDPARYLAASYKPAGMPGMVQIGGAPVQISGMPVQSGAPRRLEKDLVCGMSVDPRTAAATADHVGKTYYFCSRGCAEKFRNDPGKYLSPSTIRPAAPHAEFPKAPRTSARWIPRFIRTTRARVPSAAWRSSRSLPVAATKTQWTCPMHPEIVRDAPGSCPICGMALEPKTVTAAEQENPELRDMTWRFWTSVGFGIPLVTFAMLRMSPWLHARGLAASRQLDRVRAWRRPSCCGVDGRSSSAAGRR